jgi:protein-S-isoprenylcysteine O-methyltransferase Ste14
MVVTGRLSLFLVSTGPGAFAAKASWLSLVSPFALIGWCWIGFFVYWLYQAIGTKRTNKRENVLRALPYRTASVAGFICLNWSLGIPFLDRRRLPADTWIGVLALSLTFAGIAFAIWARRWIGRNWSSAVTIKEDHQLIRSGPYAWVRHPIYSGILSAMAGTALGIARYRGVVGAALFFLAFYLKSRIEESFMRQTFGVAYEEYRRTTGAFFPRLRRGR